MSPERKRDERMCKKILKKRGGGEIWVPYKKSLNGRGGRILEMKGPSKSEGSGVKTYVEKGGKSGKSLKGKTNMHQKRKGGTQRDRLKECRKRGMIFTTLGASTGLPSTKVERGWTSAR